MDLNPCSTQIKPATVPKTTPASVLAAYIPTALDQGIWHGVWDMDMDEIRIKMEEDEMDSLQRRKGVELF